MTLEDTDTIFCTQFSAKIFGGWLHCDQHLSTGFLHYLSPLWLVEQTSFLVLHLLQSEL